MWRVLDSYMEHMMSYTELVWMMVTDMLPDRVLEKVTREIQDIGDMIFWERLMDTSDQLVLGTGMVTVINIPFVDMEMMVSELWLYMELPPELSKLSVRERRERFGGHMQMLPLWEKVTRGLRGV
jgi:hypothetical protein